MDFSLSKDNKQNINMFQNIEQQDRYSKFSTELNRVFGDLSYEKFYDNLIHQKRYKGQNLLNAYDTNKKKKFEEEFNIKKFKDYIKTLNEEEKNREIKLANYKKKLLMEGRPDKSLEKNLKQKKEKSLSEIKIPDVPDIGRYNPNYTFIRKKIPDIYISRNKFNPKIKYKQEGREIFREKNYNTETNYLNTSINYESQITTKNNSKINSRNSSKIFDSAISSGYDNFSRNNHALKFENYTKRKPLVEDTITKNILNTLELKSTCSPQYLRCSVKFDRMPQLPESPFPECNIEKGCPPLGMYKPNYNSIYNESPITYIKRHPVISKKYRLQKIVYKYRIPKDYLMVTSLNKNKKKEFEN